MGLPVQDMIWSYDLGFFSKPVDLDLFNSQEAREILESSESSQLGRSHMSNLKCKVASGDAFYMQNGMNLVLFTIQ